MKKWEEQSQYPQSETVTGIEDQRPEIFVNGEKYTLKDNIESVLLIGVDQYENKESQSFVNGKQADMLMLLVIDHNTESYSMVHINRDTMTTIQTLGVMGDDGGTKTAQIALSHAYGTGSKDSSRNTVKAVSHLMYGVDIPHFATIHMKSIPVLNDAVGGVTLELLDDFTMLNKQYTKGSVVTLQGDEATAYVQYRAQMEDKTNVNRMSRQRQYITAWSTSLRKALEKDDAFVTSLVLDIADDFESDMTVEQLNTLSDYFLSYTSNGITEIKGESVQNDMYMEFHVDEKALQQQVMDLFYVKISD